MIRNLFRFRSKAAGLRQYLAGEAPYAFPVHVSDKVAKGEPLTEQDWDDACFSSIREFM